MANQADSPPDGDVPGSRRHRAQQRSRAIPQCGPSGQGPYCGQCADKTCGRPQRGGGGSSCRLNTPLQEPRPEAFDDHSADLETVFAAHKAAALDEAIDHEGLETAFESREIIGRVSQASEDASPCGGRGAGVHVRIVPMSWVTIRQSTNTARGCRSTILGRWFCSGDTTGGVGRLGVLGGGVRPGGQAPRLWRGHGRRCVRGCRG
jgi:hypothetical protein